jgi:hypothetical protein
MIVGNGEAVWGQSRRDHEDHDRPLLYRGLLWQQLGRDSPSRLTSLRSWRFSAAPRTGIRRKMRADQRRTPLLTPQQSDYRRFSTATLPLPRSDQCPFAPCDALPNAGAGKRRSRPTEQTCSTSLLTLHDTHTLYKAAGRLLLICLVHVTFYSSFLFQRPYRLLRASGHDFLLNSVSTLR